MKRILIKGGTVVSSKEKKQCDVLIENDKITKIAENIDTFEEDNENVVLDAKGKYVLPGLIEPHMHINAPLGGITDILDFDSAGKCAAFGGVTTFMDFSSTLPGDSLLDAAADRLQEMREKSPLDYSIHCKVVNLASKESIEEYEKAIEENDNERIELAKKKLDEEANERLEEIPKIIENGIPTFKLFTTYREANVMIHEYFVPKILEAVKKAGGRCGFHAEDNDIAEANIKEYAAKGKLGWEDFPEHKGNDCEVAAVKNILEIAEKLDAPIFFFHISAKESVELIRQAKKRGVDVIAETCVHYLTMTKDKNKGEDGILYMMSPPLRSSEDQKALWEGLMDGTLSQVTSDNCTFPRWMKEEKLEKKDGKIVQDFTKVISGVSGIEERLGIMLSHVNTENHPALAMPEISLEKMVELCCENPAKIFGCYPKKGCLAEGSDGDVTVLELDKSFPLTLENLHYPVYSKDNKAGLEYSVYSDCTAGGSVYATIRRGEFLVKEEEYLGRPGSGIEITRKIK